MKHEHQVPLIPDEPPRPDTDPSTPGTPKWYPSGITTTRVVLGGNTTVGLMLWRLIPRLPRIYLAVLLVFGVITMLPVFHVFSRWQSMQTAEQARITLPSVQQELEEGLVYSGEVIKSVLDHRTYTTTRLDNGLRVLVVSDPKTSLAAASCDVGVGSFNDPISLPGLTHLLEHAVFLGDSKHSAANTFEKFLSEHNGYSNAFTSQENTNFYYKVSPDKLDESLDRFTDILSSPLLNVDDMVRELHAIESEFLKDKLESARQVWRLIKHLANPAHPFHSLSPGNLATLSGVKNSSEAVRDLHFHYYTPENMQCVVYGRDDPQDLLHMARRYFTKIRKSHTVAMTPLTPTGAVFTVSTLGSLVTYHPLRRGNDLSIIWPITGPSRCGIGSAVSVLSEKYDRSALVYLKRAGLATGLSWSTIISAQAFSIVRVNVKLTEAGAENYDLVASVIFSQIHVTLLQSPVKAGSWLNRIHQETLQHFINQQSPEVHHFVKVLASRMSKVLHPAYLLGAPVQPSSTQCLVATLQALSPQTSVILLGSSSRHEEYQLEEPWYEIPYNIQQLGEQVLVSLGNVQFDIAPPPDTHNIQISRTFPLYERDVEQTKWPSEIYHRNGLIVWWQQDATFHTPRIDTVMWGHTATEHTTAKEVALHFLLVEMFRDQLEDRVEGGEVGVRYQSNSGFIVTLSGYSHHEHMSRFMRQVVDVMVGLDVRGRARFEQLVKYKALTELARSDYAEAYKHPLYKSRVLLEKNVVPLDEIVMEVTRIDLATFTQFYKSLWSDISFKCLVYGNVLRSMAQDYSFILRTLTERASHTMADIMPPFHPTLKYPLGTYYTITPYPNSEETASVADLAIMLGPTPWNTDALIREEELFTRTALGRIAATVLTEPVFIELRTKQQLGYAVITKFISHFGIDYIHVCVQGSEKSAADMANSLLTFLIEYRTTLTTQLLSGSTVAKQHWDSLISAVRQEMKVKPQNQVAMAMELAAELFSPDPLPDRLDWMLAALETVTPEMLLQFYDQYVLGGESRRIVSLAQSQDRPWNLTELVHDAKLLEEKDTEATPFLYWHFSYLGLEMGK